MTRISRTEGNQGNEYYRTRRKETLFSSLSYVQSLFGAPSIRVRRRFSPLKTPKDTKNWDRRTVPLFDLISLPARRNFAYSIADCCSHGAVRRRTFHFARGIERIKQ